MSPDDFKAWRKSMGWTQTEAADALGISRGSVELYELGKRREDGRPVEIPTTISRLATLFAGLRNVRERVDNLRQSAALMASGKMGTFEMDPDRRDTTAESIKQNEAWINDLLPLISVYEDAISATKRGNKKPA